MEKVTEKKIIWMFHRQGRLIRNFRKVWIVACEKADVPDRIFHDLRRTAVRNLVRAGVPDRIAMMLTGHQARAAFERHNIVNEKDLTEGVSKLAAFSGGHPPSPAEPESQTVVEGEGKKLAGGGTVIPFPDQEVTGKRTGKEMPNLASGR